jgi:hypothetical protein
MQWLQNKIGARSQFSLCNTAPAVPTTPPCHMTGFCFQLAQLGNFFFLAM